MSQFSLEDPEHVVKEDTGYLSEIASMMHGFGDNPVPNDATVALVESIVLQQLRLMVQEASYTMELREANTITNADMVYLFRNNKFKLKRLYDYFNTVHLVKQQKIANGTNIDGEENLTSTSKSGNELRTIDVIKNLDTIGELDSIDFDAIKFARMARAAKLTESLSLSKYEAYYKARMVSFGKPGFAKTQQKFKEWLNPNNEINIAQSAYDILVYIAFETVAEIVDLVFLVRQDANRTKDDPFSKHSAGNFCNPSSLSNAVYIKSGNEGVPPISVAEVREVMRRLYNPTYRLSGLFFRNMRNELPVKFIAI